MSPPSTVITVTQLTHAIKNQLESRFLNVTVQGEMSNCKLHSSGHLYFDLKDAGAKIPAVLFRANEMPLSPPPKEGDHVIITGTLSVYPPHGKYQIIAKTLQYQRVGELLLRLEALKKKLGDRGWFDRDKKKILPKFPKRIGVVTSPTGAVIRDIIHVLARRFPGFQLILNPVRVQGSEAAFEIAEAIDQMNRYQLCDVLIVGRGGGSLEDLWPFNEEIVARAIFESAIPIISAVGHETDVTIADFVADVRAPTPSAAAEIVGAEKQHHLSFLETIRNQLSHHLLHRIKHQGAKLEVFSRHPLFSTSYALLSGPIQRLDEIKMRLETLKPTTQLTLWRSRFSGFYKQLNLTMMNTLMRSKQQLKEKNQRLEALNPKNVLKRGYSILFALGINKSSVIVSMNQLSPGLKVEALLHDGKKQLRVEESD